MSPGNEPRPDSTEQDQPAEGGDVSADVTGDVAGADAERHDRAPEDERNDPSA
jgi:hypothetical protein